MKTRLRLLPLWLTITSLITPLLGQSVSELELEKSSNLNVWESVTITPEMISNSGKLLAVSYNTEYHLPNYHLPNEAPPIPIRTLPHL